MTATSVNDLTFENAKKAISNIIGNIHQFVDDIDKVIPNQNYDKLANSLLEMDKQVQASTNKFLANDVCDEFINNFLITFTRINPKIEKNLTDFFNAYKDIADFFTNNPQAGTFQLTAYENKRIEQMAKINSASNKVLAALKNNQCDIVALYASFSIHSSKTEMSEYSILNELKKYQKIMEDNNENVNFDAIDIFSINTKIRQRDGTFGTEARAIRNLLDHHSYDLNIKNNVYEIHFLSKYQENGVSTYDKKFTAEEFCDYLLLLDLFYKTIVNILFCYQLLAVLRAKFVI